MIEFSNFTAFESVTLKKNFTSSILKGNKKTKKLFDEQKIGPTFKRKMKIDGFVFFNCCLAPKCLLLYMRFLSCLTNDLCVVFEVQTNFIVKNCVRFFRQRNFCVNDISPNNIIAHFYLSETSLESIPKRLT
jgi:hypothetical protein